MSNPGAVVPTTGIADRFWSLARGLEADETAEPMRSVLIVRHFLAVLDALDERARTGRGQTSLVGLLREAELAGDLSYASPEQVRGEMVDQRSLVFSATVLLFQRLTGRHPFGAENNTPRRVERIRRGEMGSGVNHFPAVPPGLRAVLVRSMGPFPEERWNDLLQLRARLEQFVEQESPAPRLPGTSSVDTGRTTIEDGPTRIVRNATEFGRELMAVVDRHDQRPERPKPSTRPPPAGATPSDEPDSAPARAWNGPAQTKAALLQLVKPAGGAAERAASAAPPPGVVPPGVASINPRPALPAPRPQRPSPAPTPRTSPPHAPPRSSATAAPVTESSGEIASRRHPPAPMEPAPVEPAQVDPAFTEPAFETRPTAPRVAAPSRAAAPSIDAPMTLERSRVAFVPTMPVAPVQASTRRPLLIALIGGVLGAALATGIFFWSGRRIGREPAAPITDGAAPSGSAAPRAGAAAATPDTTPGAPDAKPAAVAAVVPVNGGATAAPASDANAPDPGPDVQPIAAPPADTPTTAGTPSKLDPATAGEAAATAARGCFSAARLARGVQFGLGVAFAAKVGEIQKLYFAAGEGELVAGERGCLKRRLRGMRFGESPDTAIVVEYFMHIDATSQHVKVR